MENPWKILNASLCRYPRISGQVLLTLWFISTALAVHAGNVQLVSAPIPGATVSAGGDGFSDAPIISADGRYVLFSSTAINLVSNPYAGQVAGSARGNLQVYLRDRLAGTTTLVSANPAGQPGNYHSFPDAISTNGQYALFESQASDLVTGDTNNQMDVYLRDLVNQVTILVSVNTNGIPGNGLSQHAVMTPDARYIAFSSASTDLVPADTNGIPDIFVRDRIAGTTTLASVGATTTLSTLLPSTSDSPVITPDGRFVAFYTLATNLVAGQAAPGQVFVRDLVGSKTIWASTNAQSIFNSTYGLNVSSGTSNVCGNQLISADGNYVVFEALTNPPYLSSTLYARAAVLRYHVQTGVTDLISTNGTLPLLQVDDTVNPLDMTPDGRFVAFVSVTNTGTATASCINLWDGQSGTMTLVSQKISGPFTTNDDSAWPRFDSTGRYIAYISSSTNLTANATSGYNCYLYDSQAVTTTLLNVDTNGNGSEPGFLSPPSVCSDGHLIAFACADHAIVPGYTTNFTDVFVRDNNANTTELDSPHNPNYPDTSAGYISGNSSVSLSTNALFIAFTSEGNLVAADTNGQRDVYLRDVANQTNILVSVNTNGVAATGFSSEPSVDASGRYVAFSSYAPDLASGANNGSSDIYLRDVLTGTTTLVSQNNSGTGDANNFSATPLLSSDARYVLFYSFANNLAAGTFSGENLYLRDLLLGTNYALSTSGAGAAAMTPDGRRVAYYGSTQIYVWDTATAQRIYTNSFTPTGLGALPAPALSPDGNSVAYCSNQVIAVTQLPNTATFINSGMVASHLGLHFSSNGRFLVYALATNTLTDVYLYDLQTSANVLISQGYNSSLAANGPADSPVISPDGRFIAYRSFASNSIPNDLNACPDLMLYDRSNAVTFLITPSVAGDHTANGRSRSPVFSADGMTLAFASWAADLVPQDFNPGSDVFLVSLVGAYSNGGGNNNGLGTNAITGLQMIQIPAPTTPPAFIWTAQPGAFYHVQYKDDLNNSVWHDFNGSISVIGTLGSAYDLNSSPSNRFYRVISGQ